ncbi:MAG: translesion DNA synthesis-associated protein ImuA [Gammaproteobacteria bacterium]|nr:translesion DNA synthesis-associated protein ImuA [Gammaproteobacteria bacterium]
MSLQDLMLGAEVWRAGAASDFARGLPSGFPQLDALLPGNGWPSGMLTEILIPCLGIGELQLLLPALARLSHGRRWIAFIAPPHVLYAPALAAAQVDLSRVLLVHPRATADGLWAVEQSLRAGTCGAVLAWPAATDTRALRRLQLAAEAGRSWGVLFRSGQPAATEGSPAALRLQLVPTPGGVDVYILKRRGGWPVGPVTLDLGLDHAMAMPASAGSCA